MNDASDTARVEPGTTFESALTQLQSIVRELEEGTSGLEESLARFEQGVRLLRNCYQILEQAEQKIELLVNADAAGQLVTAPFDATATAPTAEKRQKKPGRRRATDAASKDAADSDTPPPTMPSPDQHDSATGEHTLF